MKYFVLLLVLSFAGLQKSSKIYFVPTLHGLHKINMQYNYDSLTTLIQHLNPDIIAVEIRAEDINCDSSYLKQNYPYEMWMMKYWFSNKKIVGFDWLGKDIEGKPIPANYWKNISEIKKLERALEADTIYSKTTGACDSFNNKRVALLKTLSLKDILNSEDEQLTLQYYQCLESQLKGSVHERVLNFYAMRNEMILKNIQRITKNYKGKTILILTGDDHYVFLKNKFHNDPVFW